MELKQDVIWKNNIIDWLLLLSNESINLIQQSIEVTEIPQIPEVPRILSKAKKGTKTHLYPVSNEDPSNDLDLSSLKPDRHPCMKKSCKSYDNQARYKSIIDSLRLSDGKSSIFEIWKMLI